VQTSLPVADSRGQWSGFSNHHVHPTLLSSQEMFEPIRGGTRGGQAEFKWSDVSADKDRENYLGHSINAPTGRWQKNKDVHWYNRDLDGGEAERLAEIKRVKEAEADALAVALGFAPAKRNADAEQNAAGSSNTADNDDVAKQQEKEERRRRKEEKRARKEEKRAHKEAKKALKACDHETMDNERSSAGRRDRTRSRSPRRSLSPRRMPHYEEGNRYQRSRRVSPGGSHRSRTPPWGDRRSPPHRLYTSGREGGRRDAHSADRRDRYDANRY